MKELEQKLIDGDSQWELVKEDSMGLYDTVILNCPVCNYPYQAQSKGSNDCSLRTFFLNDYVPNDVLSDVNRHAPFECENCGTIFDVQLQVSGKVNLIRSGK